MCDVMTSTLAYYDKELMTTIKSFTVQNQAKSPFMLDIMTNTLAYYNTKLIIVVKRFIVQNQALIF